MRFLKESLLPALIVGALLLLLYSFLYLKSDIFLFAAILVISIGNLFIAFSVMRMHLKGNTGLGTTTEGAYVESYRKFLHSLAGLAEIYFYTILFLFGQFTVLAGWLVIKTIGSYRIYNDDRQQSLPWRATERSENLAQKEGASVAIFRLGNLMAMAVAFIAAILLQHSTLPDTPAYAAISRMFNFVR